ncbi:MAG: adenylyltransferase/cytidyltransferase family protein, partial [Rhizobiales bacterium]|nr:adenylyltransferase/cytidyltransferase family protein [Hyphomicrobiales bacterium]
MAKTGFYPGSFDPVTYGHLDIIARSARLVDHLVLGVGVHHGKASMLDARARVDLLETVCSPISASTGMNITVATFDDLAVEAARRAGAGLVIRG